jgi:branched-subunit amino acid ABC-type transport system permease component
VTTFGDLFLAGVSTGAIYAVFALCFTMLFRTSAVLNLAVGDFAMLGAMGVDFLYRVENWPLAVAIIFDLAMVGLFAFVYDLAVLRTALEGSRAREAILVLFFFTFSLSLFIEGLAQHMFGTNVVSAPPLWNGPSLQFWGLDLQRPAVLLIGLAILTGGGFAAYLRFSLNGKAMAACGDNALGARICGIRQPSFRRGMFVAMAVLAAVFGIVESPMTGYVFNSGGSLSLLGLISAAFAGFVKPVRAVAAGLLIGIAEAMLGGYVSSQYQDTLLFTVLVAAILIRPQILGNLNPAN